MHQFLRHIAYLVVLSLLFFPSGRNAIAQERILKSKYQFSTPELNAAQKLYSAKKYPEALAAFEAIIENAKENQNYEEQIFAMEKRALSLRRLEQYDEAIETMDEAIQLSLIKLPKGHFLVSKMYYTRGTMDHSLNNYYKARDYLDTALVFYNNSIEYDSALYKRMVEYKYYAYQYSEGSQDTLLKYLSELIRFEEVTQKEYRDPNKVLLLMQGYPQIYSQKGDFEKALTYAIQGYKYALENRQKVSNRYFAESQYHIAQVLFYMKKYSKAIEVGLEAMPIVESTPRNQMPEYYAFNNLLGISLMALGDYENALPYFEKANKVTSDRWGLVDERTGLKFAARVMINIGLCYENLGQSEKALGYLQESLKQMKQVVSIPNSDFHGNYERLGDFYFKNLQWEESLILYDSALRNGISSYNSAISAFPSGDATFSYRDLTTLTKKAASLGKHGHLSKESQLMINAMDYAKKTSDILMESREEIMASEGKLFMSENFKNLYETGLEVCYNLYLNTEDNKYFNAAIEFSRSSKAILFLEQSQEFNLVNNNLVPISLKESFFKSKKTVETLQQTFNKLIDYSITNDSVFVVNETLSQAIKENQAIKDSIESVVSEFPEGEIFLSSLLKKDLIVEVPKNQALIEFFYGKENIYVLGYSSDKSSFKRIKLTSDLEKSIKEIVQVISKSPKIDKIDDQLVSFSRNAYQLYKSLLKPVLDELDRNLNHLIIVPDEFLSRLPFEVLIEKENTELDNFNQLQYLIKSFSIQYQLSSELFNKSPTEIRTQRSLLGIGFESSLSSEERSEFGSLPGTEKEINYLKSNVEGTYLIGDGGTREDFLEKAGNYDILHLAVHGEADSISRYESSLIFNGYGNNVLNTNDLYLADLKARLAVLSACESGIGVVNTGEGTFSIARGFALVGVPSVVMSLWKVNDQVTSALMVDMYNGFVNNDEPINESLRRAKLEYLSNSDAYSGHPYYWAAFLQLGENTVLNPKREEGHYLFLLLIPIILLPILLFLRKRKRAI